MFFPIDEATRRKAKSAHELTMVNLIVFNLLIGVALLAGSMAEPDSAIGRYKWLAVALPLGISLVLIGFTWLRSRYPGGSPTGSPSGSMAWFVRNHWRLAATRYRLILIAYLVCAGILSIALFGQLDESQIAEQLRTLPPAMQEMERRKLESQDMGGAVWARIGVVPLLLAIMVTIMLESGAIYQAGRGELPDELVARFPPPEGLTGTETPDASSVG
jgi:MFS superfamily sulfate permease-like transporter